jgi:hypothetical protein
MAFTFIKSLTGQWYPFIEKKPTTAEEAYTEGEALVLSSGTLTKCGATAKPTYIAAKAYTAPAEDNQDLEVYPVLPEHVFKTEFAADATANAIGTLVTLHTDGASVTATADSGVATIYEKLGTGNKDSVLVRFI